MHKDTKNLINWSQLTKQLTPQEGENKVKNPFRPEKIPSQYKEKVKTLIEYVDAWRNEVELMEKKEAFSLIKEDFREIKGKIDVLYKDMY